MRRFVDGISVDFPEESAATVSKLADRLIIHTDHGSESAIAVRIGDTVLISYKARQYKVERTPPRTRATRGGETGEIFAPMPGQIVDVLVGLGQTVEHAQKVLVLEAMKTQQAFVAPFAGQVDKLAVKPGDQVQEGQFLASIIPSEA